MIRIHDHTLNVTCSRGYIWFLGLNIVFCLWLLWRDAPHTSGLFDSAVLHTLYVVIIALSGLNMLIAYLTRSRRLVVGYFACLGATSLLGILWAIVFFRLVEHYSSPVITLVLLIIILLPATIALYISAPLLTLFSLPLVISLVLSEFLLFQKFNWSQLTGTAIIFGVVLSARYILLEWYLRTQRSERKNKLLIHQLNKAAYNDGLTGLKNKRSLAPFFENVTANLQHDEALFAILIDIDFFKQYNDIYGHIAGDSCLRQVAGCIKNAVRKGIDGVFRFGGEEFVILTVGSHTAYPRELAQRLRHNIDEARIEHQGSTIAGHLTVSIGIARWGAGMPVDILLDEADQALYQAKRNGRNCVEYRHASLSTHEP